VRPLGTATGSVHRPRAFFSCGEVAEPRRRGQRALFGHPSSHQRAGRLTTPSDRSSDATRARVPPSAIALSLEPPRCWRSQRRRRECAAPGRSTRAHDRLRPRAAPGVGVRTTPIPVIRRPVQGETVRWRPPSLGNWAGWERHRRDVRVGEGWIGRWRRPVSRGCGGERWVIRCNLPWFG
jgi:hypothetical protein